MMSADAVAEILRAWGYPAFFLLFLAAAFGSPVTEDLLLLIGGYLIGAGIFTWPVTFPLALGGVVVTDAIFHFYGRLLRRHSLKRGSWIRRIIRPGRLRIATRWFNRYRPGLVVFAARLLPGARMLVFVSAGLSGMPLWRFVLADGLGAILLVPLLLWVGERLGLQIGGIERTLEWIGDRVMWLALIALAVFLLRRLWIRRERRILPDTIL